jgi:hypothetical protein
MAPKQVANSTLRITKPPMLFRFLFGLCGGQTPSAVLAAGMFCSDSASQIERRSDAAVTVSSSRSEPWVSVEAVHSLYFPA